MIARRKNPTITLDLVNRVRAVTEYDLVTSLEHFIESPISDYVYILGVPQPNYGNLPPKWKYSPAEMWFSLRGLSLSLEIRFVNSVGFLQGKTALDPNRDIKLNTVRDIKHVFELYKVYRKFNPKCLEQKATGTLLIDFLPKLREVLQGYPEYRAQFSLFSPEIDQHKFTYPLTKAYSTGDGGRFPTLDPAYALYPVLSRVLVSSLLDIESPDNVRRGANSAVLDFSRLSSPREEQPLFKKINTLLNDAKK